MSAPNRREFLADVSRGMLAASLGSVLPGELALSPAWANKDLS